MKLSILVPIYNVEKYLKECLESIHNQTLQDMEVLCLNDGSTDNSSKIIDEYVHIDSRFRCIEKKNTGYGNTLNVGLSEARGEYIGIVESDDFIDSDMMQRLLELIENTGAEVVKSGYCYCSIGESLDGVDSDNLKGFPINKLINPINEESVFLMAQSIWSALYRKDFLTENNIRFHETPGASFQDVSFAFQVMANAKRVYLEDKPYYHYRISNPNASMKIDNKLDKLCGELDFIEKYIDNREDKEKLSPILSRLSFRILFENYSWSAPAYQFAMLNELERRLRIYEARGDFEADIWDQEAVDTAKEIIADKDAYYKKTGKKIFDYRLLQDTLNLSIYKDAILKKAMTYKSILIYGAGKVGQDIKNDLIAAGCDKSKLSFAVTEMGANHSFIDGVSVQQLEKYLQIKDEVVVIIAVKEASQYEMLQNLKNLGFQNIITLSDEIRWS